MAQQHDSKALREAFAGWQARRGLSVNAASLYLNVSRESLTRLKNGVPPELDVVERFARAANEDVNYWRELCGYPRIDSDEHAADEEWKTGIAALEAEFGAFPVGSQDVYKDRRTVAAAQEDLRRLREALEARRGMGGSGSASGESGGGSRRPNGPGGPGGVAGAPRYPRGGIRQPQSVPAAP